jgi:hypothetical protein
VKHSLGKGEVDSSILSGSTSTPNKINSLAERPPGRSAPIRAGDQIGSSSRTIGASWKLKRTFQSRLARRARGEDRCFGQHLRWLLLV